MNKEIKEYFKSIFESKEFIELWNQKENDRKELSIEEYDKKYPIEKILKDACGLEEEWYKNQSVVIIPYKEDEE